MDKEVLFAKTLNEVKKAAKEDGNYVSEEDLKEAFKELELDDSRLIMVKEYLEAQKIKVGGEKPSADETAEEEFSPADLNFLQMYLDELELLPEYNDGEKRAYTMQAMAGDKEAQKKLTEMYLKDVVQISKIYNNQGVLIEDLIGEGNLALAGAVTMLDSQEKPEDCEGMIIKYVMDAMEELIKENNDSAEVSDKALKRVNEIFEKADRLSKEYNRKITVEELCEESHVSRKAVVDAIRISGFKIDSIEMPNELKGIE
ncbi:MAG: hypothetical protein K5669_08070 [Lachnospiraceae bacterium]|nr:hypothetical protein [Lachnospiraceae bacterium]